jgi:hypothetical protein
MAQVAINKKLNLVIPIENSNGVKVWIHSTPLSRDVFELNWLLLTRTLSNLYGNGIGPALAPRTALLAFKDTMKELDDTNNSGLNLLNEIYRLTNVLMPSSNGGGWQMMPYAVVKSQKQIDEDTLAEVENAIVYFIVASAVHLRSELPSALQGLKSMWKAETTLLNVTEYGNSLTMPILDESIGEKMPIPIPPIPPQMNRVPPKASSIPS